MKPKWVTLLIAIAISSIANCQKIIIKGEETNRQLMWSDFTGKVDKSSGYSAFTKWKLKSKFGSTQINGESLVLKDFEVNVLLDTANSWVKKNQQTDDLLVHEQGHFNCGILCMRDILQTYKMTSFTKSDFLSQMQNLMTANITKYHELEVRYDEETEHGRNMDAQQKWNSFFDTNLKNK